MRKTLAALAVVTSFGALLTGCPVWGPDLQPRPDGSVVLDVPRTPDAQPDAGPSTCTGHGDCADGTYCDPSSRVCVPSSTCGTSAQCATGSYCDLRGTCIPGCASNNDCTRVATGLVCDTTHGVCIPGGQCTTNIDCTGGQVCVGGSCRAPSTVCQFNYQCSAGQSCVDGRCISSCSATSPCPSGQTCVGGFCTTRPTTGECSACPAGQVCVSGACQAPCTTDTQCGTGNYCDRGACRVDDRRPPPFCTAPAVGCASGSLCVDGVCRISCPTGTATECLSRDVNFNQCDANKICRYSNEVAPQCQRSTDCTNGRICVNALCVNPL